MTILDTPAPHDVQSVQASVGAVLTRDRTLVDQIQDWIQMRIEERVFRPGMRLPSIRRLAQERGISRFTAVEAYDRLVARGYLESRRGSGFYVREQPRRPAAPPAPDSIARQSRFDVKWLLRNMFRQLPPPHMPGSGLLPPEWMDDELLGGALRAVGRQGGKAYLGYGTPMGFLPLRDQLQLKLAEHEIAAAPDQIVLTAGATQALDLIARELLSPGDNVLIDDPAWFLIFGVFATHGVRVFGVPRLADGPDIVRLTQLIEAHRPKLYVVHSVLHNPTSTSLSAAKAFQILRLAETHDMTIVEDDVYGDLHPGKSLPATRMASLDQLKRVIHVGSFSKTLAANLRVGFIAAAADLADRLADKKMVSALTTPESGERVVYRILTEGHYRKHVERLRGRLDGVRDRAIRSLERIGLTIDSQVPAGIFLWARAGNADTNAVAARMFESGYLLAPGSLFSPDQLPSPYMRFNIATSSNPGMLDMLSSILDAEKS